MRALALVGALMSTALVLPAGAASQSTSNTTCDPGKTMPVSVPISALPVISSVVNSEIPVPTIVPVPDVSVPVYGQDTSSPVSVGHSSEDITTTIIKTGPAKTITRSLKRISVSDATSALVTGPKSVAIPTLSSVPDAVASEETAVGVPIAATTTTIPSRSASRIKRPSTTSMLDLGSDSIVTISKSLGSDSFVEWTKTIALVPSLPDLTEPTSGDFTVSFGASTTIFFTPEPLAGPASSSSDPISILPVPSSSPSTGWETVWDGSPAPVETTPPVSSVLMSQIPENTATGVLGTSGEPTFVKPTVVEPTVVEPTVVEPTVVAPTVVAPTVVEPTVVEPTSTEAIDLPPTAVVPSISLITVPYSFPAYAPLEPSTTTTDLITSLQPSTAPAIVVFTLPGDGLGEPRVVTLTTNLPVVNGTPWLPTSPSSSVADVVVTYTMPGGYGHSSSVVTFTTSRPVSTKSHVKSSPSISGSKSQTSSTKESITIATYGPWPSPTLSPSKTSTSSSKHHSVTSVSLSSGGPRHTSNHQTGTTPFTNSTISESMSVTIAPSGSGILSSAVTDFPAASDSRSMPVGTGVSFSLPITSSGVTSMSLGSSTRRTTTRGTGISSSGDTFTSAVGTPFRPSPAPSVTAPPPGSSNISGTGSVVVPTHTGPILPAQSSINATGSFSSNITTAPLSGAGQSVTVNSTAFGVPPQVTPTSGPGQGGFNSTGRSTSAAPTGTSSSISSSSSVFLLNGTLTAVSGVSTSTRPSMSQGNSGASVPLETSTPISVGLSTAVNATSASITSATSSTRLEQTQAGPGVSTSLPEPTETAVGPVQSQNVTLSLSASGNLTSSASATTGPISTTASTRGQGQGGVDLSTAGLSNTTSPDTSTTISQGGGSPLQSQDSAASANATSGTNTSSTSTVSRVGQTVGGPFPTSSTVPGRQTQGGDAGEAPTTTNVSANSSDTLTLTTSRAVQTQGGVSSALTAINETTAVTPSSARQPQSQGAASTSPTATWPPMTTQSINGTGINSASAGVNSSSAIPPLSQGNSPAPTTSAPRSQGGQGGQSTQIATDNSSGNASLTTQASSTASSVGQNAQSQTTLATVVNPATNSTTAIPATGTGSPLFCGNEWDRGNETINVSPSLV
ncbi:hypothetical protein MCOR25_009482 [Pyricularia grisea]|nr:hypothetical protein MCOR25_009482 [Pyricularia grisea]